MADHRFSDREALHIAAQIERKGERFYRMAQGVAGKGPAGPLLEMLLLDTRDEQTAQVLRAIIAEEKRHLVDLQQLLEKTR